MWKTELLVFTCLDGGPAGPDPHDYVRRYLDIHEVAATYVVSDRGPAASLKRAIRELEADLLLLGSYNGPAIREIVAGSFLDRALREVRVPIFICR
jgi:nucleotide-binding universal stress UspA family protein